MSSVLGAVIFNGIAALLVLGSSWVSTVLRDSGREPFVPSREILEEEKTDLDPLPQLLEELLTPG